ncbi:MAG TPA: nucleotidyltransferase domain-containing protein [Phycisphaerales bacterium]|nr:nucleotidyltransferase domain-containing protein [Phycisphaerales bacterium]
MNDDARSSAEKLPPILAVGTAVVALVEVRGADGRPTHPRGTAGLVVTSPLDPEHRYRVRFPGGDEVSLKRQQVQVLSVYQREGSGSPVDPLREYDLFSRVIYRCVIGSRAYGLSHEASDTDRRGVYLPPAAAHWSIYGVPEQLENEATQEVYWELEKYLKLALKGNPNVLETLYSPLVEHADPFAQRMLAVRHVFLSKLIYQTFNGYALSQMNKLEQDLRTKGKVKWKHAMHLLRLLIAGTETLRTGELPVLVTRDRDRLISVRDGAETWESVNGWRLALHGEFERAFADSRLPERPDYETANGLLLDARREMAAKERV